MRKKSWKLKLAGRAKLARRSKAIKKVKRKYEARMAGTFECACGAKITLRNYRAHFSTERHRKAVAKKRVEAFTLYYCKAGLRKLSTLGKKSPTLEDVLSDRWRCIFCGLEFPKGSVTQNTHVPYCREVITSNAISSSRALCVSHYSRLASVGYGFGLDALHMQEMRLCFSSVMGYVVYSSGRYARRSFTYSQSILIDPSANWGIGKYDLGARAGTSKLCVLRCSDTVRTKVPDFKVGSVVVLRRVNFVSTCYSGAVYVRSTPGTAWIEAPVSLEDAATSAHGEITWTKDDYVKLRLLRDWAVSFACNSKTEVPDFGSYLWPIKGRTISERPYSRPIELEGSKAALEEERPKYEIIRVPLKPERRSKKGIVEQAEDLETEPFAEDEVA